ncbi:MAG: hypothetical protein ABFS32_12135 [Bacteroidota bacterium]
MVKIILGPTIGYAAGLSPLLTIFLTVSGMMTTVLILTFIGEKLRNRIIKKYFKPKRVFSPRSRRFVKVWRNYGEMGISFLTPFLLSPPVGSIITMAFGGSRRKTIGYMLLWGVVWTTIITYTMYYAGDELREFIEAKF